MTTEYTPSTKQLNALISLAENNADMTQVRNSAFYKATQTAKSVHIDHTGTQPKLSPKVLSLITQIVSESKTIKDLSVKYNGSTVPMPAAGEASNKSVDASTKSTVTQDQDANVQNNGVMAWIKSFWGGNKTTKTSSIQDKSVDEKTSATTKAPTTDTEKKDNTPVKASDKHAPATEAPKKSGVEQVKSADKLVPATTTEASKQSGAIQKHNVQGNNSDDEHVKATIDAYTDYNKRHNNDHLHVYQVTTFKPAIAVTDNGFVFIGYVKATITVVETHVMGDSFTKLYDSDGW